VREVVCYENLVVSIAQHLGLRVFFTIMTMGWVPTHAINAYDTVRIESERSLSLVHKKTEIRFSSLTHKRQIDSSYTNLCLHSSYRQRSLSLDPRKTHLRLLTHITHVHPYTAWSLCGYQRHVRRSVLISRTSPGARRHARIGLAWR